MLNSKLPPSIKSKPRSSGHPHSHLWPLNRLLKKVNQLIHNALRRINRGDHERIRVYRTQVKIVPKTANPLNKKTRCALLLLSRNGCRNDLPQVLLQRNFAGEQFPAQFLTDFRNRKSLHPQRNLRSLNRALNRMRHESHLHLIRSYYMYCSTKDKRLQTENHCGPLCPYQNLRCKTKNKSLHRLHQCLQ